MWSSLDTRKMTAKIRISDCTGNLTTLEENITLELGKDREEGGCRRERMNRVDRQYDQIPPVKFSGQNTYSIGSERSEPRYNLGGSVIVLQSIK